MGHLALRSTTTQRSSTGCASSGSSSTLSMAAAIRRAASSLDVCDGRATCASALEETSHVELGGLLDMARKP